MFDEEKYNTNIILMVIVAVVIGWHYFPFKNNDESAKVLNNFAEEQLKGERKYWFEMKDAQTDAWMPVTLILGYDDNKGTCDFLLEDAKLNSPEGRFRCRLVK